MEDGGVPCEVCQRWFVEGELLRDGRASWGTLGELLFRGHRCAFCYFLATSIRFNRTRNPPTVRKPQDVVESGCSIRIQPRHGRSQGICEQNILSVSYDGENQFCCYVYASDLDILHSTFSGHGMVHFTDDCASTINAALIRGFIEDCTSSTGELHVSVNGCGKLAIETDPIKLDFIDVEEFRIVTADSSARFVALSYVWGKSDFLRRTKSNRQELNQIDSLRKTRPAAVIEDAIRIVQSIGERYLWVDSLCITQDDDEHIAYTINKMDYIYSESLITIIAASSKDVSEPLPGIKPNTRAPLFSRRIGRLRLIRECVSLYDWLETTTYESRAWTFQERLLSTRCLILSESEAFLTCPSAIMSEIITPADAQEYWESPTHLMAHYLHSNGDQIGNVMGRFGLFSVLVQEYTKRQLTYDADILRAFAGIMTTLQVLATLHFERSDGSMLFGIPSEGLALGLAWVSFGPATRRILCVSPSSTEWLHLPAWSWVGWTGKKLWPFMRDSRQDKLSYVPFDSTKLQTYLLAFEFQVGDGLSKNWRPVEACRPDDYNSSFSARILRFTTLVASWSVFRFRSWTRTPLPPPLDTFRGRVPTTLADCPCLEIFHDEVQFPASSSIVYGVEWQHINQSNLAMVTLFQEQEPSFDDGDDAENRIGDALIQNRTNELNRRYIEHPNLYPDGVDVGVYSTLCLVVRWLNDEQTACERIGVARIAGDMWQLKSVEKEMKKIHLF